MGLRIPLSRVLWGHALGAKAWAPSLSAAVKKPGPEPHMPQLAELPRVCLLAMRRRPLPGIVKG